MKTLRYLLMVVAMMGVLSVSAQTPKYGKPYNPGKQASYYNGQAQMPEAQMQSTGSAIMYTGSTLPSAAVEGVTTTYGPAKIGPRKTVVDGGDGDGWDDEDGDDPDKKENEPFPIGDAVWPLALLACAYLIIRVVRARKRSV